MVIKKKGLTDEQQKEHDVSQRGAQVVVDPHDPFCPTSTLPPRKHFDKHKS